MIYLKKLKLIKANCFKCGIEKEHTIPFYMIDDWGQYQINICQDCLKGVSHKIMEASGEDWLCPICKSIYACTICGEKHSTKSCTFYIPDTNSETEILKVIKIVENRIKECPSCKSTNLMSDTEKIECAGCGWIHFINGRITKVE